MTQKNKLHFLFKFFVNDDLGHYLVELLMLDFDIVKLLRFTLNGEDKKKLLKILRSILREKDFKLSAKDDFIFISKQGIDLDENKIHDSDYLGHKLGFPDCCIKNHLEAKNPERQIDHIAIGSFNDWHLNIFYHESIYHLIPHWPCSFNCAASLKMATNFFESLKRFFPELAAGFARRLQGDFWHIYELGNTMKIKTKFSDDVLFKLTGEKNNDNEIINPILAYEEFYKLNKDFEVFLQELADIDKLKLIDNKNILIEKQGQEKELVLPKNFRQISKFIDFK